MEFFVVPRNRQALLGMLDIETLSIPNIYCNTIDNKEVDKAQKHRTNTANS